MSNKDDKDKYYKELLPLGLKYAEVSGMLNSIQLIFKENFEVGHWCLLNLKNLILCSFYLGEERLLASP